jgi:putative hemolysin
MKKIFILIFLIVLILVVAGIWYVNSKGNKNPSSLPSSSPTAQVTYICDNNKTIEAAFYKGESKPVKPGEPPIPSGSVKIVLSDGRNFDLPQTISADGGRYANSDESFIFWSRGDTAFINEGATTTFKNCILSNSNIDNSGQTSAGLSNPASLNCIKLGGNLVINTRGDGGQYGLCYFEDNRACEEWALMRGDCPVGGVKTTGFDTIDQMYCAWSGGKTLAVPNSVCTFKDGKKCSTLDFYNGACSD